MEKPHAVIPLEMYDKLKWHAENWNEIKDQVDLLREREEILITALEKMTMIALHTPYTNDSMDVLASCGLQFEHPYAGSKSLGKLHFIK